MDLKPLLIAIEGPDGAGKTTLARNLAETMGAVYLKRPAPGSAAHRAFGDPSISTPGLIALMRADCKAALDLAQGHMAQGRSVILDRHYLSCAVYQGAQANWQKILAEDVAAFGQPHAWVIVTADPADIYVRLRRRVDDAHANMSMSAINERLDLYRSAAHYLGASSTVIDYRTWAHSITVANIRGGSTCTVLGANDLARKSAASFLAAMVRT